MAINVTASMLAAKHAIPHLQAAGGGSIVNISSIAGTHGFGSGAYAASKAALIGLTRDWAYLHGRAGIRVNCLVVGHAHTPMGSQEGEEMRERRRRAGVLSTEVSAWDVAWPAVFLASDEARSITGVALTVDAGTDRGDGARYRDAERGFLGVRGYRGGRGPPLAVGPTTVPSSSARVARSRPPRLRSRRRVWRSSRTSAISIRRVSD